MRPKFACINWLTEEDVRANIAHCASLGHAMLATEAPHTRRLAVIGGGPSLHSHLDEIRVFDAVWAVNASHQFLRGHGIESSMITVDAAAEVSAYASGAKAAIVATRCHQSVFAALDGADVTTFNLHQDGEDGVIGGTSTATCAFHAAVKAGFRKITFFGCESSFARDGVTHAYRNEPRDHLMLVECNGGEFLTAPDFYVQATELSAIIKKFPSLVTQVGGGLLGAMVENDDHEVVKMSRALMATFGDIGKKLAEAA